MTPSPEEREQSAIRSLATAAEWRRKGNARWELTTLSDTVKTLLGVAVERFGDAVAGTQFLKDKNVGQLLGRMADLNWCLYEVLRRDGKPTAGAVDNQITPVHVAWLLECWDSGQHLLAACVDEVIRRFFPLTALWAEYHRAMDCLAANRPYYPVIPRVRGYEQYWIPYLKLVAELTNRRPIATARVEMAASFAKRNRDKRLTDWEMIDGDGKHPVRWDFREASILKFAEHRLQAEKATS
jgi:hypothetical protein